MAELVNHTDDDPVDATRPDAHSSLHVELLITCNPLTPLLRFVLDLSYNLFLQFCSSCIGATLYVTMVAYHHHF